MKQNLYIISSGVFYRPIKTKSGNAGWVGEITFWYTNDGKTANIPNISKVFPTKLEAELYVSKKLNRLYKNDKYLVRTQDSSWYTAHAKPM